MVLGNAVLWCPECEVARVAKVLSMTPAQTKITWARCTCGFEFEPGLVYVPDLRKYDNDDEDHTPVETTEE